MAALGTHHPPWPIMAPGIWFDIRMAPLEMPRPALFLDRDGVINVDSGFLSDPAQLALVPGTADLIKAAMTAGVPVLVVTNQSGIDRGLFGWHDFAAVEARIAGLLAACGAATGATAACPFHPDHTDGYDETHAAWRKPGPGMINALAEKLIIDLAGSWLIGDRLHDMEAARNAGLAGGILIGDPRTDPGPARAGFAVRAVHTPSDAMALLRKTALFDAP